MLWAEQPPAALPPVAVPPVARPQKKPLGIVAWFVIVTLCGMLAIFCAIFVVPLIFLANQTPEERVLSSQKSEAAEFAKQVVLDNLKSPASAKFVGGPYVKPQADGSFEVFGEVDAQNSFGALLRKTYTMRLTPLGNDKWRYEKLSMHGR